MPKFVAVGSKMTGSRMQHLSGDAILIMFDTAHAPQQKLTKPGTEVAWSGIVGQNR